QDPYRDAGLLRPGVAAPGVLAEAVAVAERLLEHVLQLGRHGALADRLLPDGRHDLDHVDFLRADPEAVHAGRAQPQIGVVEQVHAGLDLAVDLAGPVIADEVD